MEISDLLSPDSVLVSVRATSKKQALRELAHRASELANIDERAILDVLIERERLGTTGIGRGIAIPHGKLPDLERLYGIFAVLDQPIDFDSVDDQPADLLFLLLAPETAGADHLKALARISRLLRDAGMCDRLRSMSNADDIFKLLTASPESHAA